MLEDKGYSLALHYRLAPQAERFIFEAVAAIRADLPEAPIEVLNGKFVVEIKHEGFSKATAVRELMQQPPFAGRRPIFLGDDVTDESVFAIMGDIDGIACSVGRKAQGVVRAFRFAARRAYVARAHAQGTRICSDSSAWRQREPGSRRSARVPVRFQAAPGRNHIAERRFIFRTMVGSGAVNLVVVSNRVASSKSNEPMTGGLAAALLPVIEKSGAIWVGSSGRVNPRAQAPVNRRNRSRSAPARWRRLDLPAADYGGFYEGFANSALWPALHSRSRSHSASQ